MIPFTEVKVMTLVGETGSDLLLGDRGDDT